MVDDTQLSNEEYGDPFTTGGSNQITCLHDIAEVTELKYSPIPIGELNEIGKYFQLDKMCRPCLNPFFPTTSSLDEQRVDLKIQKRTKSKVVQHTMMQSDSYNPTIVDAYQSHKPCSNLREDTPKTEEQLGNPIESLSTNSYYVISNGYEKATQSLTKAQASRQSRTFVDLPKELIHDVPTLLSIIISDAVHSTHILEQIIQQTFQPR